MEKAIVLLARIGGERTGDNPVLQEKKKRVQLHQPVTSALRGACNTLVLYTHWKCGSLYPSVPQKTTTLR